MVLLSSGLELWVQVGEERAAEYKEEKIKEKDVETTTCYIEAKVDRDIKIFYENLIVKAENEEMVIRVTMDGQRISGTHYAYSREVYVGELKGKRVSEDSIQGLRFGKLQITEDPASDIYSSEQFDDICTIKIEIIPMLIEARKKSTEASDKKRKVDTMILYENNKAAKWGICTQPGSVVKDKSLTCRNVHKPITGAIKEVVYFKYRPHFWFVVQGFIEDAPRDECHDEGDDIKIDEHRTERAANKRKAKELKQSRLASVKLKIEKDEFKEDKKPVKAKIVKLEIDMTQDEI